MSNSISLNIKLDSNNEVSCKNIVQLLIKEGWSIVKDDKIAFLPINDNDMFDWTSEKISMNDFVKLIDKKEELGELVAVELYWKDTDIGGHLLFYSSNDFSFGLNINTKYITTKTKVPDFNWYFERIIPCLEQHYHIMQYNFEFTY